MTMKHLILTIAVLLFNAIPVMAETPPSFPSFADLVEKLQPSVVNISTTALAEEGSVATNTEGETLGSGFIISKEGYIVTNQHVIDHAKIINVTLFNNEKLEAEIIGEDKMTDLALLKITTTTALTPAEFGDSDAVRVGDWILAIGNPFGLGGSVTAGIVSAKARDIESGSYDNFIQTDAAINQGNSGGPMFNLKGEVIGVSSAIFSDTGTSMGIGFATPSKMTEWVINQLRRNGKVTRGWIGISIQPSPEGLVISRITEDSPAQKAGLQAGDIITKFNATPLTSATNLSRMIAESAIDEPLNFEIVRDNKPQTIQVRTIAMPEENASPDNHQENPAPSAKEEPNNEEKKTETETSPKKSPLGLEINNLTPDIIKKYNLPQNTNGVVITSIDGLSDASDKGLQIGNLITKVDKKDVWDTDSFNEYIQEAQHENNRPVLLTIQDSETEHFVAIKLR